MEGWLEKRTDSSEDWKKYWVILLENKLFFFFDKKDFCKKMLAGHLEVRVVSKGPWDQKTFYMNVECLKATHQLKCPDLLAREQWLTALRLAVESYAGPTAESFTEATAHPQADTDELFDANDVIVSAPLYSDINLALGQKDDNDKYPWFIRAINRNRAEALILRHGVEGSFLVRSSESDPGSYTMTVLEGLEAKHYKITRQGEEYMLTGVPDLSFVTIYALVQHYIKECKGSAYAVDKTVLLNLERTSTGTPAVSHVGTPARLPGQLVPQVQLETPEERRLRKEKESSMQAR